MEIYTKEIDSDKIADEALIQTLAYKYAPQIRGAVIGEKTSKLLMDKIEGKTLYELYGDDPEDVPENVWGTIRRMLQELYDEHDIQYVDVTPYNFIVDKYGRMWIVDYGDAMLCSDITNWFLVDFLEGENSWNSDFA